MIKIGVVGATGIVGLEIQKVLHESFKKKDIEVLCFASKNNLEKGVSELESSWGKLAECAFILNASNDEIAAQIKENLKPQQVLIDNSSQFRMDPEVPLMIPEINGSLLQSGPSVIANPNCTAIFLALALYPLKDFGISRVIVSTYQAASGAGLKALEELDEQIKAVGTGRAVPKPQVFPHQIAMNVLSHNSTVRSEEDIGAGYNGEEWKVIEELRKILDIRHLPVSATCVRVPVRRAHTEAVTVDLKNPVNLDQLRECFAKAKGLKVVDNWEKNHFPMPLEAENQDLVYVGRIRKDATLGRTVHFLIAGDQLRKGAAVNAVQIMQEIHRLRN